MLRHHHDSDQNHENVSGTDPDYILIIRVSGTDPDGHNCYLSPEEVSAISADNLEYSPGFVHVHLSDL